MCHRSVTYARYACGHEYPSDAGVVVDCNKDNCVYSNSHRRACVQCNCTRWYVFRLSPHYSYSVRVFRMKQSQKGRTISVNSLCSSCCR
ncbi:hypothetical protein BDP27DRAFT_557963 [Rhodocollybia butyracea]|uniref:Uncharacterized protein n=1 Tax=Rhodocollybia butyracea TaxID=206335 RepID=A0A9P5P7I3_9AGAR|nr:hypothetical protein BDP27DRAFT_557963 [Rhodocollybia butyracea]